MKNITTLLLSLVVLFFASCKDDDDPQPDPTADQVEKLSRTWGVTSVDLDGDNVTSQWAAFTLTFNTNFNYSTTNGISPVWEPTGTWSFGGTNDNPVLTTIIRSDNVDMTILNIAEDASTLTLRFNIVGAEPGRGGRISSLNGEYTFELAAP